MPHYRGRSMTFGNRKTHSLSLINRRLDITYPRWC